MLLESDSSWLTVAGPYPMLPRFSAVRCLVLTAPGLSSTPTSAVRLSALQPPTPLSGPATNSFSPVQLPTLSLLSSHQLSLSWVASSTLVRVPLPLPDTARFHVQESFVWFRAKADSSALAAYPHSATPLLHLGVVAIEKGAFWSPSTTVANYNFYKLSSNNGYYRHLHFPCFF